MTPEEYACRVYLGYTKMFRGLLDGGHKVAATSVLVTCFVECFGMLEIESRRQVKADLLRFLDKIGEEVFEDKEDLISVLQETTLEIIQDLENKYE